MTSPGLTIIGCGMVTALGYNARSTLAALRAGISGVRSEAWPDIESGEPIRCARVDLPQRGVATGLLADLVAPAIDECWRNVGIPRFEDVPLLIGVAHPSRVGRPSRLDKELLPEIQDRLGIAACSESKLFAADQAGCAMALFEAQRLLSEHRADYVVVAGVDSFLDRRETLDAYVDRRRILTPANINGFLPGEAGTAMLVVGERRAQRGLCIAGWGEALESATIEDTRPLRGIGLTSAIKTALQTAGVSMSEIGFRVTDLSGEHYKFKEAMFALMRLDHAPRETPLDLWHPIEYLGEIGAAILPCLLAWTWHADHFDYAPGPRALCHIGSDEGRRFALVAWAQTS